MNRFFRSALFPLIIIVLLVYLASQTLLPGRSEQQKITYSQLIAKVKEGAVNDVEFNPNRQQITANLVEGGKVKVNYPTAQSATQFQNLLERRTSSSTRRERARRRGGRCSSTSSRSSSSSRFWIFLMNQVQGGGSKVMSFGKSRAKRMSPDSPKVTFKDVAGADEAVEELHEIKEFLENPKKFQALGARIPKGVLLYGPPGTGKTLLARAVAGEAGVPFFSISGSDFVEMFVGVGASRVRDLFEQAKQASPCIIFMDEIDAVGRHRGAGLGGGHDEREQTLNQLLVEMDGFEMKDNIILIAATNRPDILDPALLRPGRFDRQIVVDRPDRLGRRKILEVHSRGKPLSRDIDLDTLAAGTPGFTGADLSNLINEAALLAARNGKKMIEQDELEEGIMRVIAGPEKKARLLSEKERKITAYHEMGHALVGHYLENTNPVHKITIVSRGQALGLTISLPTEDKYLTTKSALMDELAMTLGGRAAEELVFHEVTTGAANDLERVTATSKQMIMRFGMSREARATRPRAESRPPVPRPRHGFRARLLGRGGKGDRRRDPPRHRGGARVGDERPARRTWTSSTACRRSSSSARRSTRTSSSASSQASPRSRSSPRRPRLPAIEEPEADAKPKLKPQPRPIPGTAMQRLRQTRRPRSATTVFVPEGFQPPLGLATDQFTLEPLGPEYNERDYAAWSSSLEHIRASPGFGPDSSWPHEMSLAENRGRPRAARTGLRRAKRVHVLRPRFRRRRDRLCLRLPGRRRSARRSRAFVGAEVAGRPRPAASRGGSEVARERLAVRAAALRARARLISARPRAR